LPPEVEARVAIEQASTFGWERYVGAKGRIIGMHTFGASAPLKELQTKFGFEPEKVVVVAKELLQEQRSFTPREKVAKVKEPLPDEGKRSKNRNLPNTLFRKQKKPLKSFTELSADWAGSVRAESQNIKPPQPQIEAELARKVPPPNVPQIPDFRGHHGWGI